VRSTALLGALLARWTAALLVRTISTAQNSVFLDLSLDTRMLGFVLAVAGLTSLLFGLLLPGGNRGEAQTWRISRTTAQGKEGLVQSDPAGTLGVII
jgi:hypothetical protein